MDVEKLKQVERERRVKAMTLAILRRAKNSDIPEDMMRINRNEFKDLLFEGYPKHNNVENFTNSIYDNSMQLFSYPFIVIDGGGGENTSEERKKAGCALLFRMIACDKEGKYEPFSSFAHKFQGAINFNELSRNAYVDEMCSYDVLFLSEFSPSNIKSSSPDAGCYIDEVLERRKDRKRPTIISFCKPIKSLSFSNDNVDISEDTYGKYIYYLSRHDMEPIFNALRVRVKHTVVKGI